LPHKVELALPILIHEDKTGENLTEPKSQGEHILGAMTIQSAEESAFDQDDILILQGIADSLASAIENSRLFAASEASLREIRTLHSQYLEKAWRRETALRGEIEYSYESSDPTLTQSPADKLLEIPIRLRDQVIGFLTIEPSQADDPMDMSQPKWSSEQLALIENVTDQAALALENARLLEETRRKANLERTATSITSKMWASATMMLSCDSAPELSIHLSP
jgi:GAF domain-containing protein